MIKLKKVNSYFISTLSFLFCLPVLIYPQNKQVTGIPAEVDFSNKLRKWDGFGFNYVETCQTRDYNEYKQDYGGFSLLNEDQKDEIIELVFGNNGLDVDILKMFLDPWHQEQPGGEFDHETTTKNILDFARKGSDLKKKNNEHIDVITTLYGPPPWATEQKHIGGRDLDDTKIEPLADYMINWAKFLRKNEINVKYLSIHNEGEDFYRWTYDEGKQKFERFDYNMYWRPNEINTFVKLLYDKIQRQNIDNLFVTNGEPSNWTRFYHWGYTKSLFDDDEVMDKLGLITTHGFINGDFEKLSFSTANSLTNDLLRSKRPNLHSWVTSFAWGKMDTKFIKMIHENIYSAKINGIIPWAGIQVPEEWIGGDALGNGIVVNQNGNYELTNGYYLYKQVTSAGKRGMSVVYTYLANPHANIIAFSGDETKNPDAFVVTSYIRIWGSPLEIEIKGTKSKKFNAFRTNEDGSELYKYIGIFEIENGKVIYDPPKGTVTTFIATEGN